jgi:hypothetical protein
VGHRNARLTFHGRWLLVQRVREQGMPVAHVAKAMGISRQCAHRWLARFDGEPRADVVALSGEHGNPLFLQLQPDRQQLRLRRRRGGLFQIGAQRADFVDNVIERRGLPLRLSRGRNAANDEDTGDRNQFRAHLLPS